MLVLQIHIASHAWLFTVDLGMAISPLACLAHSSLTQLPLQYICAHSILFWMQPDYFGCGMQEKMKVKDTQVRTVGAEYSVIPSPWLCDWQRLHACEDGPAANPGAADYKMASITDVKLAWLFSTPLIRGQRQVIFIVSWL